ncbi:24791_t:CDS:1, partial [Racocetra persica]
SLSVDNFYMLCAEAKACLNCYTKAADFLLCQKRVIVDENGKVR